MPTDGRTRGGMLKLSNDLSPSTELTGGTGTTVSSKCCLCRRGKCAIFAKNDVETFTLWKTHQHGEAPEEVVVAHAQRTRSHASTSGEEGVLLLVSFTMRTNVVTADRGPTNSRDFASSAIQK